MGPQTGKLQVGAAIMTGAASGIGRATALRLAAARWVDVGENGGLLAHPPTFAELLQAAP